ncbi:hypothetical protein [Novosphingobium malaysiense]|uniref:Uncharacterized protein n=1 Tax=Novosphingobium malaysiense TaxID=1348853 RepID=A0A0B1ZQ24_9SPHN|nr:hypothetical protein [Novosphingobium malaysiense]KHK92671.1 hypothetical protein LK12_07945 [Novosphingobium malaysiense]
MGDSIYAFKGEGVAWQTLNYRQGARHTLMVFARARSIADAEKFAHQIAADNGWLHVDLHNGAEVTAQPYELEEQYLRDALEDAIQFGSSMVTYEKELPSDA